MSVNEGPFTKSMSHTEFAILEHICHFTDLILRLVTLDNVFPCVITPQEIPENESTFKFSFSMIFADESHFTIN